MIIRSTFLLMSLQVIQFRYGLEFPRLSYSSFVQAFQDVIRWDLRHTRILTSLCGLRITLCIEPDSVQQQSSQETTRMRVSERLWIDVVLSQCLRSRVAIPPKDNDFWTAHPDQAEESTCSQLTVVEDLTAMDYRGCSAHETSGYRRRS